jgi:hypothetical protein
LGLIHRQQNETSDNHPNRATAGKSYSSPAGALECVAPAGRLGPRPRKAALSSFVLFFFWFGFGDFKWFQIVFV